MRVEAIRDGYYNHRRVYKGQVIDLFKEEDFSKAWMKAADGKATPAPVPHAEEKVAEPVEAVVEETESDDVI